MKTAWIFPLHKKCGISFYTHRYLHALSGKIDTVAIDSDTALLNKPSTAAILQTCDCLHVQYETSLFMPPHALKTLCTLIQKPVIVTLHEVYNEFPGVFPRSRIRGTGMYRACKECIYDLRHPLQKAFRQHCASRFYADTIVVHAGYQKSILAQKGVPVSKVEVIPMPVEAGNTSRPRISKNSPLNLCSLGFINRNYNYPLLFDTLQKITLPWRFTWIGGVRTKNDNDILQTITHEIAKRKWHDHFTITGWVSDEQRNEFLAQSPICLALFSARSTSMSIATALGARRYVIATDLPYTREINQSNAAISIVPPACDAVVNEIISITSDSSKQETMQKAIIAYTETHSYDIMAQKLVALYEKICL